MRITRRLRALMDRLTGTRRCPQCSRAVNDDLADCDSCTAAEMLNATRQELDEAVHGLALLMNEQFNALRSSPAARGILR